MFQNIVRRGRSTWECRLIALYIRDPCRSSRSASARWASGVATHRLAGAGSDGEMLVVDGVGNIRSLVFHYIE